MLVYGIGCSYTGWGVDIQDELLVYRVGVSIRDGVLVNGMGCYFPAWGVTFRHGVLVYGIGC